MNVRSLRLFALSAAWATLAAATTVTPPVSPVADAAMRGDVAAIRALIARRADVNAPQGDGMTALHWAADRGDSAMAVELLRAKANVTMRTRMVSSARRAPRPANTGSMRWTKWMRARWRTTTT